MTASEPTVFVVDDDASVRRALARLLSSVGLRVESFPGAAAFLERAPQGERGCILLDVRMPTTNGLDLQRELTSRGIDMPVIFVSAHADLPVTVRAMKAGALEVLTKPFEDEALIAAVKHALARDDARHAAFLEQEQLRERFATLTNRERTVMSLVVTGMLNKQVAGLLGTSEKTIKVHRAQVMAKMGAASLPDLVRMADRLGLTPDLPSEGVPKVQ
jgi:FixJ family two-component response regulator